MLFTIYSITNSKTNDCYIGSTTASLQHRLQRHLSASKTFPNRKVYKCFNAVGKENLFISPLEQIDLDSKSIARLRERYYINMYNPSLNTQIPNRTKAECMKAYREAHKDEIRIKNKEYKLRVKFSRYIALCCIVFRWEQFKTNL